MIRVGILSVAHMHADSYAKQLSSLPGTKLVGLYDAVATRAVQRSVVYGCPVFESADALIAAADAVIVTAENVYHRALTEAAARAGRHVLCEKPLATTADDARAMVDVCQMAGVQLMTAFPCRYSPAFQQLTNAVRAGAIGDVLAVRGTNHGQCPGGWFVDATLSGGGTVTDHTVHVTDLLRTLLGSEVRTVYCEMDNGIVHGSVEDTGFVALTFEDGVFGTLDASWSRPRAFPIWGDVTLSVTGTRGVLEMDMFAQAVTRYSGGDDTVRYHGWGSDIDGGLVRSFIDAIANGTPVPITGVDGLRAVEVVEAAYTSARTQQVAQVIRR